jgi:isocitrate/isopropylmalate dehydrogenase
MNNKEPRKPRSAAVSVRIQANTYSNLRKIQDELSQEMGGVNLTLSQVIAIVVIEYSQGHTAQAAKQREIDEDEKAEAAWREIQEEEAGRIAAQEREWAEDEGRDPAELTSIDVLGRR